jgi:hypothetical protein
MRHLNMLAWRFRERPRVVPTLLMLLTLPLACGGGEKTVHGTLLDIAALEQSYPPSLYIMGVGRSSGGPSQAEEMARADIARQIDSEIQGILKRKSAQTGNRFYQSSLQEISETFRFARAELTEDKRAHTVCAADRCAAVAVLEKAALAAELTRDLTPLGERFRLAATAAQQEHGDPIAFTTRLRNAEKLFAALATTHAQLRMLDPSAPTQRGGDEGEHEQTFLDLLATHQEVLSTLRLTILRGSVTPSKAWGPVAGALAGALGECGGVATTGARCRSGLGLKVDASIPVGPGWVGPKCHLALSARLVDCSRGEGRELSTIDLTKLKILGAHPTDADVCVDQVVQRTTVKALKPELRQAMRNVLPLR